MIVFLSRPIICRNRFSSHWNVDTDISGGEMFQLKIILILEYLIRDWLNPDLLSCEEVKLSQPR